MNINIQEGYVDKGNSQAQREKEMLFNNGTSAIDQLLNGANDLTESQAIDEVLNSNPTD